MIEKETMKKFPEETYDAFSPEFVNMRKEASALTLKFNTTGDITHLETLFNRKFDDVLINPPFHCNYGGDKIQFGKKVFINFNCVFQPCGGITIGDNAFIGPNVQMYTAIHPTDPEQRVKGDCSCSKIEIGKDVWIGGGAIILPGVSIGDGCTIGSGSVVTKSIPDRSIAVGNPCRVIKSV